MRNLTVKLDERQLRAVKIQAAINGEGVRELVSRALDDVVSVQADEMAASALNQNESRP